MSSTRTQPGAEDDELHTALSFAGLMGLKRLPSPSPTVEEPEKIERFQSLARPFPPGEGDRSFGGHVYAQSAYAASKTVKKGFVIHVHLSCRALRETYR